MILGQPQPPAKIRQPQVRRAGARERNRSKRTVSTRNSLVKCSRCRWAGAGNQLTRGPRGVRPVRAGALGLRFSAFPARAGAIVVTHSRFRVLKSRIEPDLEYSIHSKRGFWGRRKWPQASRIRRPRGTREVACGSTRRHMLEGRR